jgi:hypothetical protein
MSTDRNDGDQPTTPIPRTTRGDDPTQIFDTFGAPAAQDESEPRTQALPTDAPRTEALPTGTPRTEALPTDVPRTQALPTDAPPTEALSTDLPRTHALPVGAATSAAGTEPPVRVSTASTTGGMPAGGSAGAMPLGGPTSALPTGGTTLRDPEPALADTIPSDATPAGATATTTAKRPVSRTLRVGTVVWGLIIALIGVGFIAVAAGARFDVELVLIGLLALAGVALVAGSMAVSMRRRH